MAPPEFGEQTVCSQMVIFFLTTNSLIKAILAKGLRFSKFLEVFFMHSRGGFAPVFPNLRKRFKL
jgi:hypothetical protein